MLSEIKRVLFVNVEFGSGFPTSQGPSRIKTLTPKDLIDELFAEIRTNVGVETRYCAPESREELKELIFEIVDSHTLVLSPDNAVSYGLLRAFYDKGLPPDVDIVFDQHQDIYSRKTHGSELTKSNPYRFALNEKLIRRVTFVGSRKLEEAFHNPWILFPRPDFLYAWWRNAQGQHAWLEEYINSIPAELVENFADGLLQALWLFSSYRGAGILKGEAPLSSLAVEIDLDVFDSALIRGVDYGAHLPERELKKAKERFRSSGMIRWINPRALYNLIYDRWVLSYIKHKIEYPGLRMPKTYEIALFAYFLAALPLPCRFVHITEFKPEYDDADKRTTNLVYRIITALIYASRNQKAAV